MKPSLPQGTRDFSAVTLKKRQYIFNTIQKVFELYGFEPLETPAMENLETLMGKYGEEGDKLIFKILNNGLDNASKLAKTQEGFNKIVEGKSSTAITERALRYDLTIPFARFVAMNYNQLTLPYKRFQIQPVWRADRPQKGRYREFYQCDADVVGSKSLLNEVELIHIYTTAFAQLNVPVTLKINSRKILAALAEVAGSAQSLTDITVAIDKLDKIGIEKVNEELASKGINATAINTINTYLTISGNNAQKLQSITNLLGHTVAGQAGIEELQYVLQYHAQNPVLDIDFTLARGLNYYTGIIFEVKANGVQMGSIGGGGRYDNLTALFGVANVPGVGISFGVDRIYDVMEEIQAFPQHLTTAAKVLFFNLGVAESTHALELMQNLRQQNIACELYHETAKFDKQFKYAEKKGIANIAIIGEAEINNKTVVVKNLASGQQTTYKQEELIGVFL